MLCLPLMYGGGDAHKKDNSLSLSNDNSNSREEILLDLQHALRNVTQNCELLTCFLSMVCGIEVIRAININLKKQEFMNST